MIYKNISVFIIILLFAFPAVLEASWPLTSGSGDYLNYYEPFDAGRTNTTTASVNVNYDLRGAIGPVMNLGTNSTAYALRQGMYFDVYRDLLPPEPVNVMSALAQADGTVDLTWNVVTDLENQVWGYRVYRIYYYGLQKFETRLVEAWDNTGTAYTDDSDLLAGVQYYYEVRPIDGALNENQNNRQLVVEVISQPHSITDLAADSLPGGDIALSWSAVSGAEYYSIYRSLTYGAKGDKISLDGDITLPNYLDVKTNLNAGQRYFYVAQAVVSSVEETKGNNQASAVSDQGGPNAPLIRSDTHPVQGQSYADPHPDFYWIRSADPGLNQDLSGYYVKLDNSSTTGAATAGPDWEFVSATEKSYPGVDNGTWYFHCMGVDQAGNLGAEAIYQIRILAFGTIRGAIREAGSNQGLPGMVVEAWYDGIRRGVGNTSVDGSYQIDALPFGAYTIRVNRFGSRPLEKHNVVLNIDTHPVTADMHFQSEPIIAQDKTTAYPNPAGGSEVRFIYCCDGISEVTIEIYNVAGEMVGRIRETKPAGYQYSTWPLNAVARGVYLFRVSLKGSDGKRRVLATKKFSVIK